MDRSKKTMYYQNTNFKGCDIVIIQPKRGQKMTRKDKPIQQIIQGQGDAPTVSPPTEAQLIKLSQTQTRRAGTVKKGNRNAKKAKHRVSYINDLYDAHLDWDMYEFDQDVYDMKAVKQNKPRSKVVKTPRVPQLEIAKKQKTTEIGAIKKPVAPKMDAVKKPAVSKMAAYDDEDDDDDDEGMCGLFGVYADSQDGVFFGHMMNVGVCSSTLFRGPV